MGFELEICKKRLMSEQSGVRSEQGVRSNEERFQSEIFPIPHSPFPSSIGEQNEKQN
jgi:hypothetical protein